MRAISVPPAAFLVPRAAARARWALRPISAASGGGAADSKRQQLVLCSKPGCCLCDGLKEKLRAAFSLAGPHSLHSVDLQPFTRCSPDYESTLAGIAVDPSKPGFKLLLAGFYRPFGRLPQNQLVCQVFDSMSSSWTRLVFSHCDEFIHMNRNQVVYADGALHWFTQSCLYVFAFDVSDCLWKKIQLPDEVVAAREGARAYLLEMEGAVSVIRITGVWMCIWVLVDPAGERWSLADRVHLRCIGAYAANVFPVSQTREVVFLASQKKVFTYGRREKVWREIYAMDGSAYPLWFSAHSFRGTLFSCH